MNFTGHGVGRALHEAPDHILNYYDSWDKELLKEGKVIAFEPFISTGAQEVYQKNDGWTYSTEEKSLCCPNRAYHNRDKRRTHDYYTIIHVSKSSRVCLIPSGLLTIRIKIIKVMGEYELHNQT